MPTAQHIRQPGPVRQTMAARDDRIPAREAGLVDVATVFAVMDWWWSSTPSTAPTPR